MAPMEKFKLGLRSLGQESSLDSSHLNPSGFSSDRAQVLIQRASGRVVSLSACGKISAISFAVGVLVGFTLKRRLRQWAARLLKRLKDD